MNRDKLFRAIEDRTGLEIPSNMLYIPDTLEEDNKSVNLVSGSHRIVVSLNGDFEPYSPTVMFHGWDRNGFACYVYGHGGTVMDSHYIFDYDKQKFNQVEALTSFNCERFMATIAFLNADGICSEIGVSCKGYINDELVKEDFRYFEMTRKIVCNFEYFDSRNGFINT